MRRLEEMGKQFCPDKRCRWKEQCVLAHLFDVNNQGERKEHNNLNSTKNCLFLFCVCCAFCLVGVCSTVCDCHRWYHRLRSLWSHQWNCRHLWKAQYVASCGCKRILISNAKNEHKAVQISSLLWHYDQYQYVQCYYHVVTRAGCVGRRFADVQETQTQAEWSGEVNEHIAWSCKHGFRQISCTSASLLSL